MAQDAGDRQRWLTGLMAFRREHENSVSGTPLSPVKELIRTATVIRKAPVRNRI